MWRFILNFKKQTEQNHKFLFWGFGYAQICHQGAQGFDAARPTAAQGRGDFEENFSFAIRRRISIRREVANGKSKPKI